MVARSSRTTGLTLFICTYVQIAFYSLQVYTQMHFMQMYKHIIYKIIIACQYTTTLDVLTTFLAFVYSNSDVVEGHSKVFK